jgi:hypothetical protein
MLLLACILFHYGYAFASYYKIILDLQHCIWIIVDVALEKLHIKYNYLYVEELKKV